MKKFNLFLAYFAIKDYHSTTYGDCCYTFESETKPKITNIVLDQIKEKIRSNEGLDSIAILSWKWFDED